MAREFPHDQVVETYDASEEGGPFWVRLKVPEGLPVFKDDRPWAEAIMAHCNPTSGRCFAVALAFEKLVPLFLERYPDGIGTGTPNDEGFAAEIKYGRQLTASRIEVKGVVSINVIPGKSEEESATEPGSDTSTGSTSGDTEYGGPDIGASDSPPPTEGEGPSGL